MSTLLQLDSSPLETSISRELTREFAKVWKANHLDGTVIYRNLAADAPQSVDAEWIAAAYTPEAQLTAEQRATLAVSEKLIAELETADEYVIGVAMHNFHIPAVLKLWIDQIVRRGRTFTYGPNGPSGLLQGNKATVMTASGGVYEAGTPGAALNFIEPYLRTMLGFLGVSDVKFVTAGGVARLLSGGVDRETFLQPTMEQIRKVAA